MPRKPISDTVKQQVKRALRAGDKNPGQIALEYGISRGSVLRIREEMTAEAKQRVPEASTRVAAAVEEMRAIAPEVSPADFSAIMLRLVGALTDEASLEKARIGSKEGAARAATAIIQVHQEMYPQTLEEAAEWLIHLPGFSPGRFAAILREKYSQVG